MCKEKKVEIYLIHCLVQWTFKLIKLLKLTFLKLPNCFYLFGLNLKTKSRSNLRRKNFSGNSELIEFGHL